jgi:hypothetical protein
MLSNEVDPAYASPNVRVAPELTVSREASFVALMRVDVPVIIKPRLPPPKFIVEFKVTLPTQLMFEELPAPTMVPVNPVQFKEPAETVNWFTVTVFAPELASKNTSSEVVGTDTPPAPPDVAAHLVPAVLSQFAVPPTQ